MLTGDTSKEEQRSIIKRLETGGRGDQPEIRVSYIISILDELHRSDPADMLSNCQSIIVRLGSRYEAHVCVAGEDRQV